MNPATDSPGHPTQTVVAPHRRRHLIVTALLVTVAVGFVALLKIGLGFNPNKVPPALLAKAAFPFKVAWIQGQNILATQDTSEFRLEDFRGKPLVLNFWASWCVSCRSEAHELEAFWKEAQSQGVYVVGIAIQDTVDEAQNFARYFGKTYILGLDVDGKAAIDYGVSGVPETFLIDRQGIIQHKEIGPVSVKLLKEMLPRIL